jgi:hypothetical protein
MSTRSLIKKPTSRTSKAISFIPTRKSIALNTKLLYFNKQNIIDRDINDNFFNNINLNFGNKIHLLSLDNLHNRIKIKDRIKDRIKEWVYEDDADDFYEAFKEQNFKLNYKISNFFFRRFINQDTNFPIILNDLIRIIRNEFNQIDEFKQILVLCIKSLIFLIINFKKLLSLEKYFMITEQKSPEYIILYRGFSYGFNTEILDEVNRQISTTNSLVTINAVLSTSIKLSVAINFSTDNGTIWRIIVNKEKFEKFKYSYLSSDIEINKTTIQDISSENEFLLNYGIKLIYMESKEINHNGKNLTIQTFTFDDYDTNDKDNHFREFISNSLDYIDSITTFE